MQCKLDEIGSHLKGISGLLYALAFQAENGVDVDGACLLLVANMVCDTQRLCEETARAAEACDKIL